MSARPWPRRDRPVSDASDTHRVLRWNRPKEDNLRHPNRHTDRFATSARTSAGRREPRRGMNGLDSGATLRFRLVEMVSGTRGGPGARMAPGRVVRSLLAISRLPAVTAAFAFGTNDGALPGSTENWAHLTVAGLPAGMAWLMPKPARPRTAWTVFVGLGTLTALRCLATTEIGPAPRPTDAAAWGRRDRWGCPRNRPSRAGTTGVRGAD